jgi:hypothetical protein
MTSEQAAPRTYGGWRRRRPMGLLGLGPAGTLALLGAIVAVLATVTLSPRAALYVAPPVLAGAALSLARIQGIPLATAALIRVRWWRAAARDWTSYRAGIVTACPRAWQLPGVLAPTMLVSAEDGYGGRYGLVWDRHTGHLTATVRVTPASAWLADRADADTWVANWGAWLASLGYIPAVRWVSVTVDTAPEPGTTLADAVAAAASPDAPAAARQILAAVAAAAPQAAADTATRVSVTFDPKTDPARPADLAAAAAAVSRCLPGLTAALGTCGVAVDGLASPADLAGTVRAAFDPAARGEISRLLAAGRAGRTPGEALSWLDAGPVGAEELADAYQHDSGLSVTWAWHEAPRQNVSAGVLARLASPGPFPKRLTLQYRPFPAAAATRAMEQEVNAAAFRDAARRRTRRDQTARDSYDQARAAQAAAEEAQGAGVVLIGLYVTVTVTDAADLPRAVAVTEAAAEASRIRLRRMYNSQAAGFAATLPCGICPPELSRRWPR